MKRGYADEKIKKEVGVDYKAVNTVLCTIQRILGMQQLCQKIGREEKIVKIGETAMSRRKYKRG